MTVSLWDGAFIFSAKSTQYPDRLVGEGLSGVIMCEAARQKERIWLEMIRPTLSDFTGWALFSTTPQGKNWFHKLFMKALPDSNPEWFGYRGPAWRNNFVYKTPTNDFDVKTLVHMMDQNPSATAFELIREYKLTINYEIAQLANDLTIPAFQQEIAAEFTDFVGKVFKEFDDEVHVRRLTYDPSWETVAAVDYGFANPNVWLLIQIGPWGESTFLKNFIWKTSPQKCISHMRYYVADCVLMSAMNSIQIRHRLEIRKCSLPYSIAMEKASGRNRIRAVN